jgi:chromosome segregation ATPase
MRILLFFTLALSGLLLACGNTNTADEQTNEVVEELNDVSEEVRDAFRSEQTALRADLQDSREKIDEELTELNAQLEEASASAKADIQADIDRLEAWGQRIDQRLAQLGEDLQQDWKVFADETRQSLQDFENEMAEITK